MALVVRWGPRSGAALLALLLSCTHAPPAAGTRAGAAEAGPPFQALAPELAQGLVQAHGEAERARIERGVRQVTAQWRASDGDADALRAFVARWYVPGDAARAELRERFSRVLEQLDGHLVEMGRALRSWSELELGPQRPIDEVLAGYDPGAHLSEDLFDGKLAFVALLNFPLASLDEMAAQGPRWTRAQWAEARLARRFALRPSGKAQLARAQAAAAAEAYVAGDNLWVHHLLGPGGARPFAKGVRLLSHWNLRDEIKADYADPKDGLVKQRLIRAAMERIVDQSIPRAVLDDPRLDWDPVANQVSRAPEAETERPPPNQGKRPAQPVVSAEREPDTRYAVLLDDFRAARLTDPDSPFAPTEVDRRFQLDRELPEERVVQLLEQILSSDVAPRVAALIRARLGRPLEPHDVWYAGFLPRAAHTEEELNALTRKRYPTAAAYKKDIPRLLRALGFSDDKARELDAHIVVDPARGSGHALGAARRDSLLPGWGPGDNPHLRTRVGPDGMDYKGYNIAVHEMGHNVEQYFSLYEVDDTLMAGVPNTAFTEALAFTFQARDLELLGLPPPDARSERLRVLNDFWATWEICGPALVDTRVWEWMYAHPDATPAQLREATLAIARGVWDRYYAKLLGGPGSGLLAIYSHMLNAFFYLPDYPLGHLIAFQLERKFKQAGAQGGAEFERVARVGRLSPDLWMENAAGSKVSAEPLLQAAREAAQAEEKGAGR